MNIDGYNIVAADVFGDQAEHTCMHLLYRRRDDGRWLMRFESDNPSWRAEVDELEGYEPSEAEVAEMLAPKH